MAEAAMTLVGPPPSWAPPAAPLRMLQRCGGRHDSSCPCKQLLQRRSATGSHSAVTHIPTIVEDVLASPGQPLDAPTRAFMERGFGRGFADVRVHTDGRAAASARAVDAHAYTVGRDIAFDTGTYAPHDPAGRRLLAHELTHVVQQSAGGPPPGIAHEIEADRGADRAAGGEALTAVAPAGPGLQRQEKEGPPSGGGALGRIRGLVVERVLSTLGIKGGGAGVAAAALTGMVTELVVELGGPRGAAILSNMASYSFKDVPKLVGGYLVGLVEGIISPITDLFGLGVFMEQLRNIAMHLAVSAITKRDELSRDIGDLLSSIGGSIMAPLRAIGASIRERPVELVIALLSLPQTIQAQAEKIAYSIGKAGGASIVKTLEEPFSTEKKPEKPAPSWVTSPLARISHEAEALHGKVIETPWAKIGNKLGYAVGFVAVNVVLFVFTDGIGNGIVKLSGELGKVGGWIGKVFGRLGAGVSKAAELMGSIGKGIEAVETLIGSLFGKLLKPLESVLEPVMKPLATFLEKLKGFLKKLFGVAEKEGAPVLTTAAAKGAAELVDPKLAPKVPKPTPKPTPTVEPKPIPKTATGAVTHEKPLAAGTGTIADDAAKKVGTDGGAVQPAARTGEGTGGKVAAAEVQAAEKPLATSKGAAGHEIDITKRGIEVCSPDPCPLLDVMYRKELAANEKLAKAWSEIQELRRGNQPGKAAERAAELQKTLESIRLRGRVLDDVKLTQAQRRRLEGIMDSAERYGGELTEDGAEKLANRLRGKSRDEIDRALNELEEAVTDVAGTLAGLKSRRGGEPVGTGNIQGPAMKRGPGGNVPNTAAPKKGPDQPPGFEDLVPEGHGQVKGSPGGRQPGPKTTGGTYAHEYFEDLPKMSRDNIDRMFPEGTLPPGLEKEVQVPHPDWPAGRKPRIDRLDRATGEIIEIGPDHLYDQKLVEAQQYAEWMNKYADPPANGGRWWAGPPRTYNQATLLAYLREIGVLPKLGPRGLP